MLKGIATLGAEKVPVVPVLAEGDYVLPQDGCPAVLAPWRIKLVPVEMAVEAEPLVTVFGSRFPRLFREDLTLCPAADSFEALRSLIVRFRTDF